jgi:hypothetical protein
LFEFEGESSYEEGLVEDFMADSFAPYFSLLYQSSFFEIISPKGFPDFKKGLSVEDHFTAAAFEQVVDFDKVFSKYRPLPKGNTSAQKFEESSRMSASVSGSTKALDISSFRVKFIRGTPSDIQIKQLFFPRKKITKLICEKLFCNDFNSMETFMKKEVIRLNDFRSAYYSLAEEGEKNLDEITQFQPFFELYLKNVFEHLENYGDHPQYKSYPALSETLTTEISVNNNMKKSTDPAPASTAPGSLLTGVSSGICENMKSNSSAEPVPVPIESLKESTVHLTGHTDVAIHSTPLSGTVSSQFPEKLIYADAILELKKGFGALCHSLSYHPKEQTIGEVMALGDMVKAHLADHFKSVGDVDPRVNGSVKAGLTDLFVMFIVIRTNDNQYGITNSILPPEEYVEALLFLLCSWTSEDLKERLKEMDSGTPYTTEDDNDDSRGNDSKGNPKDEKKDGEQDDDYEDDDNDDGGNPSKKLFPPHNHAEKENLQNMVITPSLNYEQRQEEELKKRDYMKAWTEAAGETFLTSEVLGAHQLKHKKKPLGLRVRF